MTDSECAWVLEAWMAYEDGELSPRERVRLEGHLGSCPRCRAETQEMQRSWALFQESYSPQEPPRELPPLEFAASRRPPVTWPWAAAALAAALIFIAHVPAEREPAQEPPVEARGQDLDPRTVELALSLERGPEELSAAWAREIGGEPYE